MADKSLNDCAEPNPFGDGRNLDPVNSPCNDCDRQPSLNDVPFFQDAARDREGIGQPANCDPQMTGAIVEDFSRPPNRNVVFRYGRGKQGCDEAVRNLFKGLVVIDEQAGVHPVPITWATQERAVAAMLQANVRKDGSTVVDRIPIPALAIHDTEFSINPARYCYHQAIDYLRDRRGDGKPGFTTRERYDRDTVFGVSRGVPVDIGYTLFAWTLYKEDMNQIVEQVVTKFSPVAYIRVQGVQWETIVKLESIANNENVEPGGSTLRVIKWQFNLRAETFIPQPLVRHKAVLRTRVDISDEVDDSEIEEIVARLEEAAGGVDID